MASSYAPWWERLLHKTPLYKVGPICRNYHWFTDKRCHCCVNEHITGLWNGGVYNFETGREEKADAAE